MPYKSNATRNARDRARYHESKSKQPIESKSAFHDFVRVRPETIRHVEDDVYYFDVVIGPLTLPDTRYDSATGSWFPTTATMSASKRPRLKPAWFVSHLRPLIIEAIEAKFDIELDRFEKAEASAPKPTRPFQERARELWNLFLEADDFIDVCKDEGYSVEAARMWMKENIKPVSLAELWDEYGSKSDFVLFLEAALAEGVELVNAKQWLIDEGHAVRAPKQPAEESAEALPEPQEPKQPTPATRPSAVEKNSNVAPAKPTRPLPIISGKAWATR